MTHIDELLSAREIHVIMCKLSEYRYKLLLTGLERHFAAIGSPFRKCNGVFSQRFAPRHPSPSRILLRSTCRISSGGVRTVTATSLSIAITLTYIHKNAFPVLNLHPLICVFARNVHWCTNNIQKCVPLLHLCFALLWVNCMTEICGMVDKNQYFP